MNIALFPSSYFPHVGGVEEVTRQLARVLREQGDHTSIITNRWPKTLPEIEQFEATTIQRHIFRVPEHTWRQMGGAILFGRRASQNVCRQLLAQSAQVIHVHCVSSNAHYALAAKRQLGLPLVVTLHAELTMDATGLFRRSAFARGLMRRALMGADAVTACSKRTLSDAEAFLGQSLGSRARVIYNGADPKTFDRAEAYQHSRPYVFALGRLVPQKGFDLLIRAFAASSASCRETHDLIIAGDGPEAASLKSLATQANARVHFLGQIERDKATSLIKGSSFVVLPSRADEGLPMVLLESMAAGRPVVAACVGGVPEIVVDGQTGILFERNNLAALTTAIDVLIGSEAVRSRMSATARLHADRFSWSKIAQQYREVYDAVRVRSTRLNSVSAKTV